MGDINVLAWFVSLPWGVVQLFDKVTTRIRLTWFLFLLIKQKKGGCSLF